ncbi:hypothetical protein GCM10027399_00790 [Curvibacter fontanus]
MNQSKLGRYELIRVLGKGAMGLVYEGRDPNLDRRVAIKTIKVENLSSEEAAEYEIRFRTEARSAARLQHPNIVSVYDSDRDGDIAYLVMEFIQGDDLKHHLDQGERYTLEQAASIMSDLLEALDYAHRQNIVHRDIKPANLLIEASGRIKLTDFGVARIQDSGEATRTKGTVVGTLKYMSPEQLRGLPIDSRSDLFSAGIVLYQLLTGTRPFDGPGDYEIIQKIVSEEAAAPSTINPKLPPAIDQLVACALDKSRERRYPTAREFNAALQAAAGSAADPTITPPKAAPRSGESSTWTSTVVKGESLVSTSSGSTSGVPGSTVTQEVELVYWKEIKDSVDIDEFRDFLLKFPSGIYSDLARRRIKRLTNPGEKIGSQSGFGTDARPTVVDLETDADEPEATRKLTPRAATPGQARSGPAVAGSKRGWILGGIGAVAVAAMAVGYLGMSRPVAPPPQPAALVQDTAPASPATAAPVPQPTDIPKAVAAIPAKAAPPVKAATPASAKAAGAGKTAPASAPTPAPAPTADSNALPDPNGECKGRILLGYLTCMKEQCDKPRFAPHTACKELREQEQRNQQPVQ